MILNFMNFTDNENEYNEILNRKLFEMTEGEEDWNIRFKIIDFVNEKFIDIKKFIKENYNGMD